WMRPADAKTLPRGGLIHAREERDYGIEQADVEDVEDVAGGPGDAHCTARAGDLVEAVNEASHAGAIHAGNAGDVEDHQLLPRPHKVVDHGDDRFTFDAHHHFAGELNDNGSGNWFTLRDFEHEGYSVDRSERARQWPVTASSHGGGETVTARLNAVYCTLPMQLRAFAYMAGAALAISTCAAAAITTQVVATSNPSTSVYKQNVQIGGQVQTVSSGQGTPSGVA